MLSIDMNIYITLTRLCNKVRFYGWKNKIFKQFVTVLLIAAQNIDSWYSLEPLEPFNVYLQSMF